MKKQGVTLIELLIVLTVIAIAGALAMPDMLKGKENRETKNALDTLETIVHGIRAYKLDYGVFPAALRDLEPPTSTFPNGKGLVDPLQYAHARPRILSTSTKPGFEYSIQTILPNTACAIAQRVQCTLVTGNTCGRTTVTRVLSSCLYSNVGAGGTLDKYVGDNPVGLFNLGKAPTGFMPPAPGGGGITGGGTTGGTTT